MPKMPINKTQPQTGINIQITTLIEAMMDSEKCLFRNNDANLMKNIHLHGTIEATENNRPSHERLTDPPPMQAGRG